jgi:hypothetical protein
LVPFHRRYEVVLILIALGLGAVHTGIRVRGFRIWHTLVLVEAHPERDCVDFGD